MCYSNKDSKAEETQMLHTVQEARGVILYNLVVRNLKNRLNLWERQKVTDGKHEGAFWQVANVLYPDVSGG